MLFYLLVCHASGLFALLFDHSGAQAQEAELNRSPSHGFLENQVMELDESRFPLTWAPDDVAWSCDLQGYGQSSPVIWDGLIFATSVEGANKERCLVTAINSKSGVVEWVHEEPAEVPAENTPMISRAAPTPVCDASGLFVFFETGNLVALNHSGQVRWQRKLQGDLGKFENKFGVSSSLAQVEDKLFVLLDHDASSLLVAINKTDGTNAWNAPRSNLGHSWTSPAIVRVDGQPLIVCSSIGSVDVYDPNNGGLLASHKSVGGNSVATPIDCGQGRFLVSSLIRPADGPVQGATKSNLMAQIVKNDGVYSIKIQWVAENARGAFCSPIKHGDYCYWINPQGVLFCLDAATGKEHYAKRLPCGGCWATPLAIGQRLYCFGRDGETVVVRVGSSYEELSAGNRIWDESPAEQPVQESTNTKQPPAATTGRIASRPGLYSAIALQEGLVIRRGDVVVYIASSAAIPIDKAAP